MNNFSELVVSDRIKTNLSQAGFTTPTPVQAGSLPPALEGKDILATAQTGTGKTLAFMIPIIQKLLQSKSYGVQALVLVPTRELAMQVFESFEQINRGLGVNGVLVVGGLSERHQLQSMRRGVQLVVATPGRLDDFIKRRLVDLSQVSILVLDEADRMLDMGFLPQMRTILQALPKSRQSMCFSATFAPEVMHLVHQYLTAPVRVAIGSTTRHADSVKLQVYEVSRENKLRLLLHLLQIEQGSVLVFTRTKHGADKVKKKLSAAGISAAVIHGNRSQGQRTAALKGFQAGDYRVLVATDIAARGIHVDDIAHVINFDLPQVPEDFIHRVGRTGRVDATGIATTLVTPQERGEIFQIERVLKVRIERLPVPADLPVEPEVRHSASDDSMGRGYGVRPGYRSRNAGELSRNGSSRGSFVPQRRSGGYRGRASSGARSGYSRFSRSR